MGLVATGARCGRVGVPSLIEFANSTLRGSSSVWWRPYLARVAATLPLGVLTQSGLGVHPAQLIACGFSFPPVTAPMRQS